MKLARIELENFRCLDHLVLDLTDARGLPADLVVIEGETGSGKSSILTAVAGLLDVTGRSGAASLLTSDRRVGSERARVRVDWVETLDQGSWNEPVQSHAALERQCTGGLWTLAPWCMTDEARTPFYSWLAHVTDDNRSPAGLVIAFDAHRALPSVRIDGPHALALPGHRVDGACQPTVHGDAGPSRRFALLKQWIVDLNDRRLAAFSEFHLAVPLWERLADALDRIVAPWTFAGVDPNFDVLFDTPTGRLPIEALSDGLRSLIVIVTEVAFRLSQTTDEPARIFDQEAVCLVDELDAHLPMRSQRTVLPILRATFPGVQWLVTTRSPAVVDSVPDAQVFELQDHFA